MAKLRILNGDEAGREFPLVSGQTMILGRSDECDIMIESVPGVSRRHASFVEVDGRWNVSDLGSHNGVYVGRERVDMAPLTHEDHMWFSNAEVQFIDDGTEAAAWDGVPAAAVPDVEGPGEVTLAVPVPEPPVPEPIPELEPEPEPIMVDEYLEPEPEPEEPEMEPEEPEVEPEPEPAPEPTVPDPLADADVDPGRIREIGAASDRIEAEMGKIIVGQREVLHQLLVALLANGHCLMLGLPGLAKTLMISTLSQVLELAFKRIQFTPDLMPSDIVGSDVLEIDEATGQRSFRFLPGPVFTNMLLADEINRTPPKTQAALLEAMQERQVSAGNERFPLPKPFFVLATQNPLEQEGTYPLPEAQLDRFMFLIVVDYPSEDEEEQIVMTTTRRQKVTIDPVITGDELLELQGVVRDLRVSPHVVKYATRLVRSTRPKDPAAPDYIRDYVSCGAGPRAAQFLVLGAKAEAVLDGRLNVSCDDVRALALPVLRHRLFTNFTADSEDITTDSLVERLLLSVPEPGPSDYA